MKVRNLPYPFLRGQPLKNSQFGGGGVLPIVDYTVGSPLRGCFQLSRRDQPNGNVFLRVIQV